MRVMAARSLPTSSPRNSRSAYATSSSRYLLPPAHNNKVRVIKGFSDARCKRSSLPDGLVVQASAGKKGSSFASNKRPRSPPSQNHDTGILDYAASGQGAPPQQRTARENRMIRAAAASNTCCASHAWNRVGPRPEDLVRPAMQIIHPIIVSTVPQARISRSPACETSRTRARRAPSAPDAGIRGRDRHALRAARSHPARDAVFLHAKIDRLPPLVTLVVVVAPRIKAKVAAQRTHIANVRRVATC